ncbi:isochorismatase family protein [Actinocatenispora sera]|uniref:isochorismatase family protein n=1 Tax=Actinocatenispora sera TaxID=390989 RepID=UPI0033F3E4BC
MSDLALLIIDLQAVYLPGMYRPEPVLTRVATLADRARAAGAPVVYLRQIVPPDEVPAGVDPRELLGSIAPRPGDVVLDKHSADAFLDTGLADLLRQRGVRRIAVTGYSTEMCVDTAVRSGLSAGFDVTLVADGHLTSVPDDPPAVASGGSSAAVVPEAASGGSAGAAAREAATSEPAAPEAARSVPPAEAALSPEAVVAHHNRVLGSIGYAHHAVTLARADEVRF